MKNRELKFRAWDDDREEMIYDLSKCTTIFWNNDEAMFVVANDQRNGDWNELEVMQFTGMKDMNGVDVYEGDIIRAYQLVGQVAYHNIRGAFIFADTKHLNEMLYQVIANTMVIGNIHEHPHLLSGGN